jgi:hypothetical protein
MKPPVKRHRAVLNFGFGGSALVVLLMLTSLGHAQPKSGVRQPTIIDPILAEKEGRAFVADLLGQKPDKSITNSGALKVRDVNDNETVVPVRFEVFVTASNWLSLFHAGPSKTGPNEGPQERLIISRSNGQPNHYEFYRGDQKKELTANQTMIPFANSDFWVADFGLEFLHWPRQLMLTKEMRHSQFCAVIESTNPNPSGAGYRKVVSWIDLDTGALIHADAYDSNNKRIKQFDPTGIKKIEGKYELEGIEMQNQKTGSHTTIKFDLK